MAELLQPPSSAPLGCFSFWRLVFMVHLLLALIYLAFISLGLPDALLGAAWPAMYGQLGVPVSYAGVISMIIAFGTILSSLASGSYTALPYAASTFGSRIAFASPCGTW